VHLGSHVIDALIGSREAIVHLRAQVVDAFVGAALGHGLHR
jgi:hypothetical protein